MSIVKISNKKHLEVLQAKLTLQLGRKLTQQETLDICIKVGLENMELLMKFIHKTPILDKKKVESILKARDELKDVPYDIEPTEISEEDKDIYY